MRRGVALARRSAILSSSQGVRVGDVTAATGAALGPGEVLLEMRTSVIGIEDTRELIHGAALDANGHGVFGTSGCGIVKAVGKAEVGLSPGDLVLAIAALPGADEGRKGLWHVKGTNVVMPISSTIRVGNGGAHKGVDQEAKEAATLPLLLSAYHILDHLKDNDILVIDELSTDCLQSAIIEVAKAKRVTIKSADSSKRATIKGAQLAVTCRSGSNSVNMMRTLGVSGTLLVYNGPIVEPLDAESTVNIPVASSIFSDVTIQGFGGFQYWHQADPKAVRKAFHGVQTLFKDGKLSANRLLSNAREFTPANDALLAEALHHSAKGSGLTLLDLSK